MKTLSISPIIPTTEEQNNTWLKKAPTAKDCKEIYTDKEDLIVYNAETGGVLCYISRGGMDKELTAKYYKAIISKKAIQKSDIRNTAAGVDVEKSSVTKVSKRPTKTMRSHHHVESSIIGFYDRYPRINYCRKTAWTQNNPQEWEYVVPYVEQVDSIYRKNCPVEYAEHRKVANKTSPDFIIGNTTFTTVTLNRNFRTHYHRDSGNLKEGLAAMSYIKTGKFSGGELCFPNFGLAVKLYNYDLIVFNNNEIHGNLPITAVTKNYQRITSVFFYRKNICYCGTAEEELERAKRNKGDGIIGPTTEDLNKGQFDAKL